MPEWGQQISSFLINPSDALYNSSTKVLLRKLQNETTKMNVKLSSLDVFKHLGLSLKQYTLQVRIKQNFSIAHNIFPHYLT